MHLLDRKPGPLELPLRRHRDADDDGAGEEQVGDDARGPSRVPGSPDSCRRLERHRVEPRVVDAHPPCRSTNRPASPRASSHDGPSSPSSRAALAATSAARHDPAATVTSRQGSSPGGRSRDRSDGAAPARRAASCRRATLLVARPPAVTVTMSPPGSLDAQRNAGREITTRVDPVGSRHRECIVHRAPLHDAVQVEHERLGAEEQPPLQRERVERRHPDRLDLRPVRRQSVEVAVVARGDHRGAHRRRHEPRPSHGRRRATTPASRRARR